MAFVKTGGDEAEVKERVISSLALAVGSLVMASRTAGTVVKATATTTPSLLMGGGIVMAAASATDTKVLINDIVYGAEYIVSTTNNSNVTHNYMRMLLTDENTVNNTGTDEATYPLVIQTGVIGVAADKKIKVEFIRALT